MQGLTENHTLWRGFPVKRSYLLLLLLLLLNHNQSDLNDQSE